MYPSFRKFLVSRLLIWQKSESNIHSTTSLLFIVKLFLLFAQIYLPLKFMFAELPSHESLLFAKCLGIAESGCSQAILSPCMHTFSSFYLHIAISTPVSRDLTITNGLFYQSNRVPARNSALCSSAALPHYRWLWEMLPSGNGTAQSEWH